MTKEEKMEKLLEEIVNDFEVEGCENCGTVSLTLINRVRVFLGWGEQ